VYLGVTVGVQEVIGVIIGGTLGHALCTSLAVVGGRCIAQHISIRTGTVVHQHCLQVHITFTVSVSCPCYTNSQSLQMDRPSDSCYSLINTLPQVVNHSVRIV